MEVIATLIASCSIAARTKPEDLKAPDASGTIWPAEKDSALSVRRRSGILTKVPNPVVPQQREIRIRADRV